MKSLLKAIAAVVGVLILIAGGVLAWLAIRSPAQRPASTEVIDRTPARVARGEYLVQHVADCGGCHSDHLWDHFGIPEKPGTLLEGGFPFDAKYGVPGVVAAQNLTPDPPTGKANWTDGELMRAIREGVSRDGHALFPMMPKFATMSDEDTRSVVAYLRTIPAIHNVIPPSRISFPVNLLMKLAPRPLDHAVTAPADASDHLGYGRYLVEIAGCQECHTPVNGKHEPLDGQEYSGGQEFPGPWGRVVSANITPDTDTFMGTTTRVAFIARFKAFASMKEAPVAGKGRNTIMPWLGFAGMTGTDLGAIFDYLKTLRPIKHEVVSFPDATP